MNFKDLHRTAFNFETTSNNDAWIELIKSLPAQHASEGNINVG